MNFEPRARFELSRVFSRTFGALGPNFGAIFLLAVAFSYLPQAVSEGLVINFQVISPDDVLRQFLATSELLLIYAAFGLGLGIGLTFVADRTARGLSVSIQDCLGQISRQFFAFLLLETIMTLCLVFSAFLLVVPAIMLSMAWAAAAPVLVLEGKRPTDSLIRSADLTRGYRWPIFGVTLLFGLITAVPSFVLSLTTRNVTPFINLVVIMPMFNSVAQVLNLLLAVAIYHELRFVKEGSSSPVADVFA